jgi:hypothetical protein
MIQTGKNWTAFFSPRKKGRMPQRITSRERERMRERMRERERERERERLSGTTPTECPGSRPRTGTRPYIGGINRMSQTTAGRCTREALSEWW